ncbi:unnamed protein product [Toxocara canis]|uniref:C-type lectin domain-containing protein n=1 Tax=Toxocara canis TaxID=6265 RepID=A0A183UZK4_TOXCA|nr:unnamed protein product [Toxocara canis]
MTVFMAGLFEALVYVSFENTTFGWIPLKKQTVSFETCYRDCRDEGEKCQGFMFTSNGYCTLIRQLFTNASGGQIPNVGNGLVYVKDSEELVNRNDVCVPKRMFAPMVKAMAACEEDWVYLVETNSCYLPVYAEHNQFSFEQAVNNCALYDANPASVHSALEMSFINTELFHASRQYWLGGRQQTPKGVWYWLDGTPFDYFNWGRGEPNEVYGSYPYCTLVNYKCCEGFWVDNGCAVIVDGKCDYLCKKPSVRAPFKN